MTITIIIRRELNPVILISNSTFRVIMLNATTAMDSPKERAICSMTTCLKKTSVQTKPDKREDKYKSFNRPDGGQTLDEVDSRLEYLPEAHPLFSLPIDIQPGWRIN